MSESSCFRTRFVIQCVYVSQTLLKSARQDLYPKFPLMQSKLSQKTSLSVRSEILGLFSNTLTAHHMYSRHKKEKFQQHVQTPLSKKPQKFSSIFPAVFESAQNFGHSEKKGQLLSLNNSNVILSEKCCYLNARKLLFQNTLRESICSRVPNTAELSTALSLS